MVEIGLVCATAPSRVQWRQERIEDCTCQSRANPFSCLFQLSYTLENKSSPCNVSGKTIYRLCRHLTRLLVNTELTKVEGSMKWIGYTLLRRKNTLAGNYAHVVLVALKPVLSCAQPLPESTAAKLIPQSLVENKGKRIQASVRYPSSQYHHGGHLSQVL